MSRQEVATVSTPVTLNNSYVASANTSYINITAERTLDMFSVDDGVNVRYATTGTFFLIMILVANFLTAVVLLLGKSLRQRKFSDWLLLSMAICNLIVFSIAAAIAEIKYFSGVYPGRWGTCYFQAFSLLVNNVSNALTFTVLSAERCLAFTKPFLYTRNVVGNTKHIILAIGGIWFISIIVAAAPFLYGGKFVLTYSFCQPQWGHSSNVVFAKFYVFVGLGLTVLTFVCNILTIRTILTLQKRMQACLSTSGQIPKMLNASVTPCDQEQDTSPPDCRWQGKVRTWLSRRNTSRWGRSQARRNKWTAGKEVPLTRMVLVVTFIFGAVSAPHLVRIFIESETGEVSSVSFSVVTQRLGIASDFLNPFLYCLLCRAYRAELKSVLERLKRALCCRNRWDEMFREKDNRRTGQRRSPKSRQNGYCQDQERSSSPTRDVVREVLAFIRTTRSHLSLAAITPDRGHGIGRATLSSCNTAHSSLSMEAFV